jgi:magnesium transporter
VNGSEAQQQTPDPGSAEFVLRCVYRSGSGQIHLDWPRERVPDALRDGEGSLWIDIVNPDNAHTTEVESLFRDDFGFHPLSIEDALNESNVPKIDEWETYLYIVFHAIDFDPQTDQVRLHELDAFLGRNYLVTYHTRPLALVDRVWRLIRRDSENRLRRRPDHVLYLLLDAGVSDHLNAIEHLDEAVDAILDSTMDHPTPATLQQIYAIKRTVAQVYRVIIPQREVANRLSRDDYPQVGARDRVYFRDVYDSLVRLHDLTEAIRDLVTGAIDTYLSVSANRTNDIMKTLTIVTVLFLPLNFIVGFFGMNFFGDNIVLGRGLLGHTLLFLAACGLMLAGSLGIWFWGKHRRWF